MTKENILYSIIGVLFGFIAGTLFTINVNQRAATTPRPSAAAPAAQQPATATEQNAIRHGDAPAATTTQPAGTTPAPQGPGVTTTPQTPNVPNGPDTSALDPKITKAEERAKAATATDADRRAAAAAYLERANVFYNAGRPDLYKFALRDFRRALRYQPDNQEALAKRDQIVDIYTKSLKRPVPDLGNEP